MRRRAWFVAMLLGSLPALGQHYPEVNALLDALFAKDLPSVAKHLPPALQKTLSDLPPPLQAVVAQEFLLAQKWRREGMKITRLETGDPLFVTEREAEDGRQQTEYSLDRRVSDGYQAVLWLRARYSGGFDSAIEIWMRYEEGEWRVFEILPRPVWRVSIDLNDPELAERFIRPAAEPNEAAAVDTLLNYGMACNMYAVRFPEIGFPSSLEILGAMDEEEEGDDSGRKLLAPELTSPPFEKSGYRFTYLVGPGTPASEYTLIARPVEFGKTGKRAFFTDESGVIRYADEDRSPTKYDPPIR